MTGPSLIETYLERLAAEGRRLETDRARELVDEVRGHIEQALDEAGNQDDVTVRTVLDRLGSPESIVDAEAGPRPSDSGNRDRAVRTAQRWGGIEIVAALLLTVGMILLPVFGPLLGLGLAWLSSYWTTREKIVISAVVLVLLVVPLLGLLAVGGGSDVISGSSEPVQISP